MPVPATRGISVYDLMFHKYFALRVLSQHYLTIYSWGLCRLARGIDILFLCLFLIGVLSELNRIEQNGTELNRIEQNGTELNRMEQNWTEWNRIEQNWTEWNRIEQNWTEWNRIEQNGTELNRIELRLLYECYTSLFKKYFKIKLNTSLNKFFLIIQINKYSILI
jgi:hypothetical protein